MTSCAAIIEGGVETMIAWDKPEALSEYDPTHVVSAT
jgi:hypothetical protein